MYHLEPVEASPKNDGISEIFSQISFVSVLDVRSCVFSINMDFVFTKSLNKQEQKVNYSTHSRLQASDAQHYFIAFADYHVRNMCSDLDELRCKI